MTDYVERLEMLGEWACGFGLLTGLPHEGDVSGFVRAQCREFLADEGGHGCKYSWVVYLWRKIMGGGAK